MRHDHDDERTLQESGRIDALERRLTKLERIMGRFMADIFDRIAAAIQAKNSGDNPAYDAHLAALDQEYSTLQGSQAGEASNIAALQTGLQKIADAVNPATAGTSTTTATGASDGTATGTGAATTGTDTGGTTTTTTTTGDQSGAAAADPNAPAAA